MLYLLLCFNRVHTLQHFWLWPDYLLTIQPVTFCHHAVEEELPRRGEKGKKRRVRPVPFDFRKVLSFIRRRCNSRQSLLQHRHQSNIWGPLLSETPILFLALFSVFSCFSSLHCLLVLHSSSVSLDYVYLRGG